MLYTVHFKLKFKLQIKNFTLGYMKTIVTNILELCLCGNFSGRKASLEF